jgi:phosphonatase-like hydrolase
VSAAWQLACLDMAGTTVRDDGLVERAFTTAVEGLGTLRGTAAYEEMLAVVRATMGQSKIDVFRRLFNGNEKVAWQANVAFEEAYGDQVRQGAIMPISGAIETITVLRKAGVKVALTTGFSQATQDAIVDALGWRDSVDLTICPSRGVRGRPYPDMVLVAAGRLDVEDMDAVVVVGDTPSDIMSGLSANAGLVLGVLTGVGDRRSLGEAGAMRTMGAIGELPGVLGVE